MVYEHRNWRLTKLIIIIKLKEKLFLVNVLWTVKYKPTLPNNPLSSIVSPDLFYMYERDSYPILFVLIHRVLVKNPFHTFRTNQEKA